ncbi:hypothetical protein F5883DRAFT_141083 [Diaporthe sp. PMI_573]|nr:hypothetical protein F5883DRAFT_141083 [Diaporthaceae sp. PMI_573]
MAILAGICLGLLAGVSIPDTGSYEMKLMSFGSRRTMWLAAFLTLAMCDPLVKSSTQNGVVIGQAVGRERGGGSP